MSLLAGFLDEVGEAAAKTAIKGFVKGQIAAGNLEASKEAECEGGVLDLVEIILGMCAKGQQTQLAQTAPSTGPRA